MELDNLDREILYELDLNSRQSASQIAKRVKSNKDTVNYRLKRLVESKIITRFITHVDIAKFGLYTFKTYIRFQDTNEAKENEFYAYLRSLPQAGWIVRASGRWDAIFAVWSPSIDAFNTLFSKILDRFSRNILEKQIIYNINWFYYNRKWLAPDMRHPSSIEIGDSPHAVKTDKTDVAILGELVYDSRKSFSDMAKRIGISPQNVLQRAKSMEKKGVIKKYGIDLNYRELGIVFCKALVDLHNINGKSLAAIRAFCASQPKIYALTTTLGAWSLELEFEVGRVEEMLEIMDLLKKKFPDFVKGYDSMVITEQTTMRYFPQV